MLQCSPEDGSGVTSWTPAGGSGLKIVRLAAAGVTDGSSANLLFMGTASVARHRSLSGASLSALWVRQLYEQSGPPPTAVV